MEYLSDRMRVEMLIPALFVFKSFLACIHPDDDNDHDEYWRIHYLLNKPIDDLLSGIGPERRAKIERRSSRIVNGFIEELDKANADPMKLIFVACLFTQGLVEDDKIIVPQGCDFNLGYEGLIEVVSRDPRYEEAKIWESAQKYAPKLRARLEAVGYYV